MTKKKRKKEKVVRNFGRIDELFLGKNPKRFSEKICPPDSEVLDPPVIRSIASLALTIVWPPYLFFGDSTTACTRSDQRIYILAYLLNSTHMRRSLLPPIPYSFNRFSS